MYNPNENNSLMAELDAILADDGLDYAGQQRARDVKTQLKYAEQYGGASKVLVGRVKSKVALWSENRVTYTITEEMYTQGGETQGVQTHADAAFIDCGSAAGVAAVLNTTPPYIWMAVDRRTKNVIATFVE